MDVGGGGGVSETMGSGVLVLGLLSMGADGGVGGGEGRKLGSAAALKLGV